ncbi:hypothetical protein [Actinomadura alba]|uniref:HEAT repeat domain-containing protein n=1 Tax=Actinomadura alba TaxID=406431 RepID=A0ABR7LT73_9ACTN|nr:hypothetical protein [Actinomadura alba]MBC6468046.1 hypothetical protein [Actinomadura alba]
MNDLLAGLDNVEWARLRHAYGSAANVPVLIRDLRAGKPDACHELWACICHQGTRYEASVPAVPFILRLAATSDTPDRPAVVELLETLAIGVVDHPAHLGLDVAAWRHEVARLPPSVTGDAGQGMSTSPWALAAYDAVRMGTPTFCALLDDPDPTVRAASAHLLGWFPEEIDLTLPHLLDLLSSEPLGDEGLFDRVFPVTASVMRLAFGSEDIWWPPAFDELTPTQQHAIRALAELGERAWRREEFRTMLQVRCLPDDQKGCRLYAGMG